jgi:chitodextrinase
LKTLFSLFRGIIKGEKTMKLKVLGSILALVCLSLNAIPAGAITKREWDFGDGGTAISKNPSHTFKKPGTYRVKLTTTGPGGASSKTVTINVIP